MSLRVAVVDDEPLARRRVLRLLRAQGADVEVVAVCASGAEAVAAIRRERPDLVFLDIQMPEMDGFGVLAALEGEPLPAFVFVTAFDEYALRAFDVHALDYLLKPFDEERFAQAFERCRARLSPRGGEASLRLLAMLEQVAERRDAAAKPAGLEWILVKIGGRMELVKTASVDWLEADGNYVRLHAGKDRWLIREKISVLEEKLDPARFVRIHRSHIVNLDRVRELRPLPSGDYVVTLSDGTEVKMSRGYRGALASRVGEYG